MTDTEILDWLELHHTIPTACGGKGASGYGIDLIHRYGAGYTVGFYTDMASPQFKTIREAVEAAADAVGIT